MQVVKDGANAAVDLVGGTFLGEVVSAMAPRGRIMVVGLTAGRSVQLDLGLILQKRLRVEGTVLRSRPHREKAQLVHSFRETVLPLLEKGQLKPVVDKVFNLSEIREVHRYIEANSNFGKVVVQID